MDTLNWLITHAIRQQGRDRKYTITFDNGPPIVQVHEHDGTHLTDYWTESIEGLPVIQEKKFY